MRASATSRRSSTGSSERGVSWKFYVQDYDPGLTIAADGRADRSTQAVRVPLLNFPRFVRDRKLFSHIVDLDEYYEDLERGTLPAVAYIAPAGGSEHPPGGVAPGQTLVRTLVNALARSEAWRSSAFMWTYDEWGGWFDHVRPPRRAAASAYLHCWSVPTRGGDLSTARHSTTPRSCGSSRTTGDSRRSPSATSRRGAWRAFDFARAPREPKLIAGGLSSASRGSPRRWLIYLLYGGAVMLAFGLIARVGSRRAQVPLAAMVGGLRPRRGPAAGARRGGASGDPDGPGGPGNALRRQRRSLRNRQLRTRRTRRRRWSARARRFAR